jgi:negative regulator of sigma E activity
MAATASEGGATQDSLATQEFPQTQVMHESSQENDEEHMPPYWAELRPLMTALPHMSMLRVVTL